MKIPFCCRTEINFKKYKKISFSELFSWTGCYCRTQWWITGFAFYILFMISFVYLEQDFKLFKADNQIEHFKSLFFYLFLTISTSIIHTTATIKRLHDLNYSGWKYLISFIPLLGIIYILFISGFLEGQNEFNEHCINEEVIHKEEKEEK
jgi:uncharacterized membrane protein YhaH (DUF805 family)